MRTLAIGDIHGCYDALRALEAFVPIEPDDTLITLGDYVDRGPRSRDVIDWLIARHATDGLIPLRGNHEIMMLAAHRSGRHLRDWLTFGGDAALRSYGDRATLADIPDLHWSFIDTLLPHHETAAHFFVHANVHPDLPLDEQPAYMLFWDFFDNPPPHESGKTMVCGHTAQKSGLPLDVGHAICIDTRCHAGGWLTCLDVDSRQYWQANEAGETRTALLER